MYRINPISGSSRWQIVRFVPMAMPIGKASPAEITNPRKTLWMLAMASLTRIPC